MGITDHLTYFLKNLYVRQEATVITRHGTTDWFKTGTGYDKAVYCHPAWLTYYEKYIMGNHLLDESQAGIKTARRNINNLRYADDTTLVEERQEELKILSRTKEESEKVGLKLNTQNTKIMASSPITSWQIEGIKVESMIYFFGLQNHRW